VHGFLAGRHYDWVVYDGLHAGAWSLDSGTPEELLKLVQGREVYRAHNVESEIWFAGARETRNPLRKALFYFQGWLVRTLETKLLLRARYTFPVSFDDETKFSRHQPKGVLKTLPIGVRVPLPLRTGQKVDKRDTALGRQGRRLLFVGKLDWPPNRDGLKWLLTHVWPKATARASDLRLTIVGSGERAWLEPFRGLPGVEIVGRVDDLVPYYDDCIATLIPVFYGSGVRVKAIESSLFGRVPVSTRLGVEGMGLTPGEHYLRAETVEDWVRALVRLNPEAARRMGERARNHARVVFDPDQVARTFVETVGLKETAHAQ
jgi:glycosyltransferase involved in cell wall biosynthesis